MYIFMTRNFTLQSLFVILPDDKCIMQTRSCDLDEYLSTKIFNEYSQIPVFGLSPKWEAIFYEMMLCNVLLPIPS